MIISTFTVSDIFQYMSYL